MDAKASASRGVAGVGSGLRGTAATAPATGPATPWTRTVPPASPTRRRPARVGSIGLSYQPSRQRGSGSGAAALLLSRMPTSSKTPTTSARTIRVAAIQVASIDGEVDRNLARAERLVEEAVARGARLVLCPEFLAAGYTYDISIWKLAERPSGPTETWLRRLAKAHGIYAGATYLEVDGEDFFNTSRSPRRTDRSQAGAQGVVAGIRGWFFKSCALPKFIDTELGRIGIGICQDNHTARFFRHVLREVRTCC